MRACKTCGADIVGRDPRAQICRGCLYAPLAAKSCKVCGDKITGRCRRATICKPCLTARQRRPARLCGACGREITKREPNAQLCWGCTRGEYRAAAKRAGSAVARAKKLGRLPMIKEGDRCVDCGGQASEYDHRDYARPLDVEMVCRGCNRRRGPAKHTPQIERLTGGELAAE